MTYSGPQIILPTEVGEVEVTFTEAGHCHVSANASSGHDPGDVVYRGRHWYVSMHLYAATGWSEDSGRADSGDYRHQFTEAGTFGGHVVPRTYRAAIVAAITKAVARYAQAHGEILAAAERNHLEHDLETAEKDVREISAKLAAAEAKAEGFRQRLGRLAR